MDHVRDFKNMFHYKKIVCLLFNYPFDGLIVVEIFVEVLKTNVLGVFIGANKKW
jgi:hypothetical protein